MGTSLWVVRVRLRSSSTGVSASTSGRFGGFGVGVVQCIPVDPPKSWFWSTKIIYFDGEKLGKLPLTVGQTQPVPKRKKGGVHTLRRRFEIRCEPCITLLWDGLLYHVLSMILSVILSAFSLDQACQGRMNSAVGSLTYAAPEVRRWDEHTAKTNPIVGMYRVAGWNL
jgi:hypothetical protein